MKQSYQRQTFWCNILSIVLVIRLVMKGQPAMLQYSLVSNISEGRGETSINVSTCPCFSTHHTQRADCVQLNSIYSSSIKSFWTPARRSCVRPSEDNYKLLALIILSGDVELNPGPRRSRWPCNFCNKGVYAVHDSLQCTACDTKAHRPCVTSGMDQNNSWFCRSCYYPCGICGINVLDSDKAVCCDNCNLRIHNLCDGIEDAKYDA